MSKSTVSRYESGETTRIKLPVIEKIAAVLGTTSKYLMGWETVKIPTSEYPELKEIDPDLTGWIEIIKEAEEVNLTPDDLKAIIKMVKRNQ